MSTSKPSELRCVTICSSRQRPKLCARMLESFYRTRGRHTEPFVYVDEKDREVEEYRRVLAGVPHEIGPHRYMCHVLNYASLVKFPGLPYYHEANDDHVFVTPNWDEKMETALDAHGGVGIATGITQNLPTAIMITGNMVRALGYWFPPEFEHHSCDLYVMDIGKEADILVNVPGVNIEHRHVVFGLAENDDNYKWVYSAQQAAIGYHAYSHWKLKRRERDVFVVKALKGEA